MFPIRISDVARVDFEAEWAYGVGDEKPSTTNVAALTAADLNSNVAIDMFLDSDQTKATNTTAAKYEVMIWLGSFGAATQPIGLKEGAVATQDVNGTTLYEHSFTHRDHYEPELTPVPVRFTLVRTVWDRVS